ncbi:MAG: fumarylacetoacetate hydrolase family protein [Pseudomonadota bacterium]
MMNPEQVEAAAVQLIADREANRLMGHWPDTWRPANTDDAYAIQDGVHAKRADAGQDLGGWKIGCTTPVMQEMLGIASPCVGGVLAADIHPSPLTASFDQFTSPLAECEIAVRLGADVPASGSGYDRDTVAPYVDTVMAAMEIAEDRYQDRSERTVAEFIADDFFQKAVVLGAERTDWQRLDLAAMTGTTHVGGEFRGRGKGSDVMGHPFAALAWLADHLAGRGKHLRKGDIVLTGSVVIATPIGRGEETTCAIEGLGEARLLLT